MKRGLTDDNPVYEVRSFSVQLIEWEKDLIDLADKLHEKWCNVIYNTFDIFLFEIQLLCFDENIISSLSLIVSFGFHVKTDCNDVTARNGRRHYNKNVIVLKSV